jgi:beta-N-acetylhexosaminidase
MRTALLRHDPARLEAIGQRLIVGYKDFSEIKDLVTHRAIAGVYVTARNAAGRSSSQIAADIAELQAIRAKQGMSKLIIAADQEGGLVSHLTPPLPAQPSLAAVIAPFAKQDDRHAAVKRFAQAQARELSALGVTMNLAPVVDLRPRAPLREDEASHIYRRAIDSDPKTVAQVASWYCNALSQAGVTCVLKHFPGLGRVMQDTHAIAGDIRATRDELENSDWIPFRQALSLPGAALMVGHVRLGAIDRAVPASHSSAVVTGLLRQTWKYDGLIMTDDMGMGAITDGAAGIGGAAVESLNAGVDLLLVANGKRHLNAVLAALLEADAKGQIGKAQEEASRRRLLNWSRAVASEP